MKQTFVVEFDAGGGWPSEVEEEAVKDALIDKGWHHVTVREIPDVDITA